MRGEIARRFAQRPLDASRHGPGEASMGDGGGPMRRARLAWWVGAAAIAAQALGCGASQAPPADVPAGGGGGGTTPSAAPAETLALRPLGHGPMSGINRDLTT